MLLRCWWCGDWKTCKIERTWHVGKDLQVKNIKTSVFFCMGTKIECFDHCKFMKTTTKSCKYQWKCKSCQNANVTKPWKGCKTEDWAAGKKVKLRGVIAGGVSLFFSTSLLVKSTYYRNQGSRDAPFFYGKQPHPWPMTSLAMPPCHFEWGSLVGECQDSDGEGAREEILWDMKMMRKCGHPQL